MKRIAAYVYTILIALVLTIWLFLRTQNPVEDKPEEIKIALREVGHKLLLYNADSLSLVLPVKQLEDLKYKLSFQNTISIIPDSLVVAIKKSFINSNLPQHYIVEVIQCSDREIAYSYKIRNTNEKDIIPCEMRFLPESCYEIAVYFLTHKQRLFKDHVPLIIISILLLALLWDIIKNRKALTNNTLNHQKEYLSLGNYMFYPDQSKLVLKKKEIPLSKKEGDLLVILASNLNQVVKRDDLVKRVWEDNGVVVSRSLDTYISKLRKKLKEDNALRLINVHGIGYKLELAN